MNSKRVHLLISGRVQGVYFRQGMMETAEKNNVLGWVRNLPDNKVESILEGNDSNVDAVIEWAHFGPAGAVVDELKISEENYTGEFQEFKIRY
ncbi:MAG TPA: acylphosphatase [Candidatus Nitrosotalea sp.]|nr:acylphosphatase [Candidatus Nitrosotalea sp.]